MKFVVDKKFFEKVDNACFGIIIARGIDNTKKYDFIEKMLADEIISMDEDPLASIKQNMEYYDQFSREELDNAKKYYDMKKVESAIFVYNYVEEDLMSEAPDWVSNDVIREYSSTYDGFVMDDYVMEYLL